MKLSRLSYTLCTTISAMFLLQACMPDGTLYEIENFSNIDPDMHLDRKDFENMGFENKKNADKRSAFDKAPPPIPSIAPILAAPRPPAIGETKLVSISVTDDVPLKDVLIELARLAKVDVELGAGIDGGISFIANDKPFNQVVERIANLAGLRYSMKNGVLRVERDSPYVETYHLDFLNITRNSNSSLEISTSVLSAGISEGGDSFSTGSDSSIETEVESDFWDSLQNNVAMILNYIPYSNVTRIVDINATEDEEGEEEATDEGETNNRFVINREAGVLSVSATDRQHALLKSYIAQLRRHMSAQVLIEAKIVEVELFDQFQSGIDWSSVIGRTSIGGTFTQTVDAIGESAIGVLSLPGASDPLTPSGTGYEQLGGLDVAVQLAERFGTTRTLSSPRLHATNNQQAVLTFAENSIFFDIDVTEEEAQLDDNGNIIRAPGLEISGEPIAIPIGIILSIIPSINLDTNEVTLNVRPTLSRQIGQVEDPVVSLVAQSNGFNLQNFIPVVEVRELDSIMKMKSGEVLVIGGLMEETSANTDLGLPWFSEIPLLGNAFKSQIKDRSKTELIIFVRATVVSSGGSYGPADQNVYETFTEDPRPLTF